MLAWMMMLAGCAKPAEPVPETIVSTVAEQRSVETQREEQKAMVTETQSTLPDTVTGSKQAYNYRLLTDQDEDALVPEITLFSDGTYGFSFDVLSSCFTAGTYTVDLSAFKGGETVTIIWYSLIRESYPAQITAMYMYEQ